jgi:hypothetical protein
VPQSEADPGCIRGGAEPRRSKRASTGRPAVERTREKPPLGAVELHPEPTELDTSTGVDVSSGAESYRNSGVFVVVGRVVRSYSDVLGDPGSGSEARRSSRRVTRLSARSKSDAEKPGVCFAATSGDGGVSSFFFLRGMTPIQATLGATACTGPTATA